MTTARTLLTACTVGAMCAGCSPGVREAKPGSDAGAPHATVALSKLLRDCEPAPVNWDLPIGRLHWGDLGPLDFASEAADLGDFDCVALAPSPLQLASYQFRQPVGTLTTLIGGARGKFGKLELQRHRGWMLLYFGPKEDLERFASPDTEELPPVAMSAGSCLGLLRMVAAVWGLKLEVEPGVIERREALLDRHRDALRRARDQERRARYGSSMEAPVRDVYRSSHRRAKLAFIVVRRTTLSEVMQRVAVSLGGECELRENTWVIRQRVDGRQVASEVERLMADLYAEAEEEEPEAVQGLLAVGRPAVPALLKALDPEQPGLAAKAARALGELKAEEAAPGIASLWESTKEKDPAPNARPAYERAANRAALIEAMGGIGGSQSVDLLAQIATTPQETDATKTAARKALVRLGAIAALTPEPTRTVSPPSKRYRFVLRPAGERPPRNSPSPIPANTCFLAATCQDSAGRHWALFECTALGKPGDMWLATSSDGRTWQDFRFTGVCDIGVQQRYYGDGQRPKFALSVADGAITLTLPALRYATAGQPAKVPIARKVKESDLRNDADGDGVTDLIEKRLGTDPKSADTDGDTVSDGVDANPLVAPPENPGDRETILQLVFAYLFGGDRSTDVLVIRSREPLRQEFYGCAGPVICVDEESPPGRNAALAAARTLCFGGPRSQDGTVLTLNGPVCFTESRTRAQVHFWIRQPGSAEAYYRYSGQPQTDQLALFEKREGKWVLTRIEPWEWISSRG